MVVTGGGGLAMGPPFLGTFTVEVVKVEGVLGGAVEEEERPLVGKDT